MNKLLLVAGFIFLAQYTFAETDCGKAYGRVTAADSDLSKHLNAAAKKEVMTMSCQKGGPGKSDIALKDSRVCVNYLTTGFMQSNWTQEDCASACRGGFVAKAQEYVNTHNSGTCTEGGRKFHVKLEAPAFIGYTKAGEVGLAEKTAKEWSCRCSFDMVFTAADSTQDAAAKGKLKPKSTQNNN